MWKCPVCGKENETFLCGCGFDGSRDYEALPTLCELGSVPVAAKSARKDQLWMRQEALLACKGCGGNSFAYSLAQNAFRCTRCGRQLNWEEIPSVPTAKPKTVTPPPAPRYTPPVPPTGAGKINGYTDYMAALEKLCREKGNRVLTRAEIQDFLNKYDLPKRFGISIYDVEQDVRKILEGSGKGSGTAPKTINTYQDYMNALDDLCRSNGIFVGGKYTLARAEIQDFLNKHDLPKRFGISVYDVEQDMKKIGKKPGKR